MPNNAYLRSTRRERQLVNEFRAKGWDACRSAGSHSPWDIWAYNPVTGDVKLIQVKTTKGGAILDVEVLNTKQGTVTTHLYKWIKKKYSTRRKRPSEGRTTSGANGA